MISARRDQPAGFDIVCVSHLRWNFVWQRPHHLMERWGRERRTFFVEEPVFDDGAKTEIRIDGGVRVVVPHLPSALTPREAEDAQRDLLDQVLVEHGIEEFVLWLYSPMALSFTSHLRPRVTLYDCMDELNAFAGAPPELAAREDQLLESADLVFTGGQSLYEAKRERHRWVYCFPSSVDVGHFGRAREPLLQPQDQSGIPRPRIGFFGVIDERIDLDLLERASAARPQWQFVFVGPTLKIDPRALPHAHNLHYLGMKEYEELPAYLAGWDVAVMPFALNEATRFISPTKTLEYLAAGKPVVSTPVADVVRAYGCGGIVQIAGTAEEFVDAIESALRDDGSQWLAHVDEVLATTSWDRTFAEMRRLVVDATQKAVCV